MNDETYASLTKKIRLQRRLHRCYELRTRFTAKTIRIVNIILPAEVMFLVLSKITSLQRYVMWLTSIDVQIAIGAAASILFVVNIVTEVLESDRLHLEHRKAIDRLTELLEEIANLDWSTKSKKAQNEAYDHFNKRFFQIATTSPTFTDKQFQRGMVYVLRSKALKMARKEAPFAPFWQVRKIAKEKVYEVIDDRDDPLFDISPPPSSKRSNQQTEGSIWTG